MKESLVSKLVRSEKKRVSKEFQRGKSNKRKKDYSMYFPHVSNRNKNNRFWIQLTNWL